MDKIRVMICDDMKDLCEAYRDVFENYDDLEFVGYALDSRDCMRMVECEKPDVLLLDICINIKGEGLDIIPKLLDKSPDTKIIMLTGFQNEEYVFNAFVNGAVDYVTKSLDFNEIVTAIRNAYNGEVSMNSNISKLLVKKSQQISDSTKSILYIINKLILLTPTEYEVLRMLYYGKSYKQIAKDKFVEETTVRTLGSRILKKLEFPNIKELVKFLSETRIMEYINNGAK